MDTNLQLGQLLGRRHAFSFVAGRCTAADAAVLRQMRDNRVWEGQASGWKQFCAAHLHLSGSQVNRTIHVLDEFGTAYFDLAQITRISPETYRLIAHAIQDRALLVDGEPIALIQENASRVAAAIANIRKAAKPAPTFASRIAAVDRCCDELVAELSDLIATRSHPHQLADLITRLQTRLDRLEKELP